MKHRGTLFVVVRTAWNDPFTKEMKGVTALGAYLSLERAEEVQGKYEQEMIDRGLGDFFEFEVQTVTYYDE